MINFYKGKKTKTKKKPKTLKEKVWDKFSLYIRLRDSDEKGYCACISCGRVRFYKDKVDAGHFIPKNSGDNIYFDEDNVHAQCRYCNYYLSSNPKLYEKNLRLKIGDKAVDELYKKVKIKKSFNEKEYLEMKKYYHEQAKKILKDKMI